MTGKKQLQFDISMAALHVLAMGFMLCDHIWAALLPSQAWLTCVGRIAFPIFAFMLVEGYFHTHSLKRYVLRLLIFAFVSEIPFDIMYGGNWFYPYHQNVLWTLLIALAGIWLMEKVKRRGRLILTILCDAGIVLAGFAAGFLAMTDYYGVGVATVFAFYFFHGKKWWCFLGQLLCLYFLNAKLLGGLYYPVTVFGYTFELAKQSLALLALIPIWAYRGRQGHHSKAFQYFCYAFYPLHIIVLDVLAAVLL